MFGAGGGTSSYREVEDAEVILLWGSNARETHPIFFHHVLKAVRRGARLFVVDPRRTSSAQWADLHLPVAVGADIALAHGIYVGFLKEPLGPPQLELVSGLRTPTDELAAAGREVFWLSRVRVAEAAFSASQLEKVLGVRTTFRNVNTVRAVAAKLSG